MLLFLLHVEFALNPAWEERSTVPKYLIRLICNKNEAGMVQVVTVEDWLPWIYIKNQKGETAATLQQSLWRSGCVSASTVKRTQFVGFTNLRRDNYTLLRFRRWPVFAPDDALRDRFLEHKVKPSLKFMHETGLRTGNWFEIPDAIKAQIALHFHKQQSVFSVTTSSLKPRLDISSLPNLTICAYDLETSGLDPVKNNIYQCCMVFWDTAQPLAPNDPRSVVICTQPTDEVGDTRVVVVRNEQALLHKIRELILKHEPDILTGFNLAFDNKFIDTKIWHYNEAARPESTAWRPSIPQHKMQFMGHISRTETAYFCRKTLSSSAMGTNEQYLWHIPGRFVLDLYIFAKQNYLSGVSFGVMYACFVTYLCTLL